VNVRKRIVKIFREICISHPNFPNVSDMCVRMLWHVGDEEGVKVWGPVQIYKSSIFSTSNSCSKIVEMLIIIIILNNIL